uniref:RING-type E3 ubiquitin transferase n=1 Tax=Kalanchoe fedtschenkoi TaxID=63787 RepID=A0A7N0RFE1_KALFE
MPETHLKSTPTMPKSLTAPTLIQSIRCTFALRRRLGCSSSAAAAVRMSATWQPKAQPSSGSNKKPKKAKAVMTKQRKVVVLTTKTAGSRRHRQQLQQQFADSESPHPVSPSPPSDSSPDSLFPSEKSFRNRRHRENTFSFAECPARCGRGTSPVNTAALDFDSVFRIPPRSGTEVFGTRYQRHAPQRTPEELAEILMLQTNILMGRSESHDRFREWRLDTDDMTYEQLLALGDKMGYVSTGLKESEIQRCVKKTKFLAKTPSPFTDEAEPKCSICQVS